MSTSIKTSHHIEMKIPALSDYVGVVRLAVSGIGTRLNFSIEEIEDLKIAVSEACTNAVQYAYTKEDVDPSIWINCYINDTQLKIEIKDTGKGFDPDNIKPRTNDDLIDEDKSNLGLGITFIKSLMDEVEFKSSIGEGTTVTMIKTL